MNKKRLQLRHYILLHPPSGAVKVLMCSSCKFIEDSQATMGTQKATTQHLHRSWMLPAGSSDLQVSTPASPCLCPVYFGHYTSGFHIWISVRLHQLHHSTENQLQMLAHQKHPLFRALQIGMPTSVPSLLLQLLCFVSLGDLERKQFQLSPKSDRPRICGSDLTCVEHCLS